MTPFKVRHHLDSNAIDNPSVYRTTAPGERLFAELRLAGGKRDKPTDSPPISPGHLADASHRAVSEGPAPVTGRNGGRARLINDDLENATPEVQRQVHRVAVDQHVSYAASTLGDAVIDTTNLDIEQAIGQAFETHAQQTTQRNP